jgi:hypothetical protein
LNRRFDRRLALLRRFGFIYKHVEGVGIVTRTVHGRVQAVAAGSLLSEHNRAFRELVLSMLSRGHSVTVRPVHSAK